MNQDNKIKHLENEIERLQKELEETKAQNIYQENIICKQSKMAEMGEMLSLIAHQWKQPLNNVGVLVQEIFFHLKLNNSEDIVDIELKKEIKNQLNYMAETISDFENFFKADKEKSSINLVKVLNDNLKLLTIPLKYANIKVNVKCISKGKILKYNEKVFNDMYLITTYVNELKQVLMNIIANSKDALIINNNSELKTIYITLERINDQDIEIIIEDNAGGIQEEKELKQIWDPYYTTKENGTGIGLYICKIIVEKNLCGSISSKNGDHGLQTKLVLHSI